MKDKETKDLVIDLCTALENSLYPEVKGKRIDPKIVNDRALKWIEENVMEDERRIMRADLLDIHKALTVMGWIQTPNSPGIEYKKGTAVLSIGYWRTKENIL